MKKSHISLGLILIILTVFTLNLTGCAEKIAENAVESAIENSAGEDVDVDLSGDNVNLNLGGAKFNAGGNVQLPSNFPADVYQIEGTVTGSMSNLGVNTYWVTITTKIPINEVSTTYQTELPKNGWTISGTSNFEGMSTLNAEKDGRQLSIIITASEEETSIILSESTQSNE